MYGRQDFSELASIEAVNNSHVFRERGLHFKAGEEDRNDLKPYCKDSRFFAGAKNTRSPAIKSEKAEGIKAYEKRLRVKAQDKISTNSSRSKRKKRKLYGR